MSNNIIEESSRFFNENLSIKIDNLIPKEVCQKLIDKYEKFASQNSIDVISQRVINECVDMVLTDRVKALLSNYFKADYKARWSTFDVVDSSASSHNYSTRWHLDGGISHTLKLFLYLTPVSEHGGNTLIIDKERTKELKKAGALPLEGENRYEDLTPILEQIGLSKDSLAYNFKAGDALLFSPLELAHKCLPPKEGKKRHTISFTIV